MNRQRTRRTQRVNGGIAAWMPRVALALTCLTASPTRADVSPELVQQLDEYLDTEVNRFHLPNLAFALVDGDEIVHVKTKGDRITEDSAFLIGSCSKTITALATLLALDEAGIGLDTPIDELLDGIRTVSDYRAPTVRELLQHRSGLTRIAGFGSIPSLNEIQANGLSLSLSYRPGEQFSYSNANYSVLGVLIEKVAGGTYCEFVQQRIFGPAGMTSSSCGPTAESANVAAEYQYCFGFSRQTSPMTPPPSRIPAGFLRSSVTDLARLQIALTHEGVIDGEQIFPAALIRLMRTPANDATYGYGMGLAIGSLESGGLIIAHEGATPTSYAFLGALVEQQRGIVLLTNINLFDPFTDHGESIYKNVFRILNGQQPVLARPYRIWLRWALIPILVLNVWQLTALLLRWKRAGWPFALPETMRRRLWLLFQLALPVGCWVFILRWVQVPFFEVLKLDPDIMWSFLFLTATGMIAGVIKECAGPDLQATRRV